ncbi:MAG: hypothetical protein PHI97_08645 [Desulfobulbus sp.]|nr:hypothetical protein [Desulfobulbus sp.]
MLAFLRVHQKEVIATFPLHATLSITESRLPLAWKRWQLPLMAGLNSIKPFSIFWALNLLRHVEALALHGKHVA